jgi:preprotein translocase subunit SecE
LKRVTWPSRLAVSSNTAVVASTTVALVVVVSVWELGARVMTTAIFG